MNPPLILFPHEPFSPSKVDTEFVSEFEAARMIGFPTGFYDHEAIDRGDANSAVNFLADVNDGQRLILRGWMIPGERYAALYDVLKAKGYHAAATRRILDSLAGKKMARHNIREITNGIARGHRTSAPNLRMLSMAAERRSEDNCEE